MNLFRFTIIDCSGGISFVAHGDALPALLKACSDGPDTVSGLLDRVDPYYRNLRDYVLNGLAVFDEKNAYGNHDAIAKALDFCRPHEQPVFRIVDERTREESLRPVKAGGIIFNLCAKRIVQIQNTYREIGRDGKGRIFDGENMTDFVFQYRLPAEWQLVP